MAAKIMVVDDKATNLLLLENKLANEMYSVITTDSGKASVQLAEDHLPDVILLDVIMPHMDGIEVCEALKGSDKLAHIPVLLLSALDTTEDRVRGLEAGADDFLTVPINDIVLFTRLRSLIRIKTLLDEMRMRSDSAAKLLGVKQAAPHHEIDVRHARILVIEDDHGQSDKIKSILGHDYQVDVAKNLEETQACLNNDHHYELLLVNSYLRGQDGIKLASYIKSMDDTRHVPVILMISENNSQAMLRALQLGINDYLTTPIDANELQARVRTQIRRKRYKETLRASYTNKESEALLDNVTKVFKREYFDEHVVAEIDYAKATGKPLSLMLVDIRGFIAVNDKLGDAGGDLVLGKIAEKIMDCTRTADSVMRYDEDSFALLLPDTDHIGTEIVAERIRQSCQHTSIHIKGQISTVEIDFNIGISAYEPKASEVSVESLVKLAEANLTDAKKKVA